MSATATKGREVRYLRRLEVLGRLLADMAWSSSLRLTRLAVRAAVRVPYERSPKTLRSTKRRFAGRSASRRMKYGYHSEPYGT